MIMIILILAHTCCTGKCREKVKADGVNTEAAIQTQVNDNKENTCL